MFSGNHILPILHVVSIFYLATTVEYKDMPVNIPAQLKGWMSMKLLLFNG